MPISQKGTALKQPCLVATLKKIYDPHPRTMLAPDAACRACRASCACIDEQACHSTFNRHLCCADNRRMDEWAIQADLDLTTVEVEIQDPDPKK